MSVFTEAQIRSAAAGVYSRSLTVLPPDIVHSIEGAIADEANPVARRALETIARSARVASEGRLVVCQDTGVPEFTVTLGLGSSIQGEPYRALKDAVAEVTKGFPLVPHVVHPLTFANTGDNVGPGVPFVRYEVAPGADWLEITSTPVPGVGTAQPLGPMWGVEGVREMVLTAVARSGNACPPFIIGVGMGGPYDNATRLARQASVRPLNERNPDPSMAALEAELLAEVNAIGMGPMNLGGNTTALAVNIEQSYGHNGCIPVAVRIECWCVRRASARLYPDGRVEYL